MLVDSQRLATRSDSAPTRPGTALLRARQHVRRGCIAGRNRTRQRGCLPRFRRNRLSPEFSILQPMQK
nr:MAG TPA: hypothetical protein [Bacteriophage sp.]